MCKYIYVFYISGFKKNSLAIVKWLPCLPKGSPSRRLVLAGSESQGCSAGVGFLYSWQVLAKSLQDRAAHEPLSLGLKPTCPQSQMHPFGVWQTPATEQRGEHAVPKASPTLCWGPSAKEEKEGGGNRGGNGMNQLRIDPNTNSKILYFI